MASSAGEPYWVLEAREVAQVEVPQEMLNHWGVFVSSQAAVDEAFEKISAQQKEFGLGRIREPRFRYGSYAFYFVDGDSNWWEIEYRTPSSSTRRCARRATRSIRTRLETGTSTMTTASLVNPDLLSHGTLECNDTPATRRFLATVRGMA